MADPEQLYTQVLQEEQQKGSSGPVAEGRAKAARARAEAGSPHPKEPKWWPGAQPHFEGGNGAAPAEEEPAAEAQEEPAEEAAPAEQPAAEAAEQPAAQAPAEQPAAQAPEHPAAQAPAEQPAQTPAQQPAAEPPAAQGGVAVATRPTTGVSHGTASGNRLRPEDGVSTEAQFAGQRAMYDRRKLIDELVATGVPAVAAADSGRARAPWLSVLYLLIPLAVVALLLANAPTETGTTTEPPPASGGGGGGGVATDSLVAEGTEFDANTIRLEPKKETDFEIENLDTVVHNLVVYSTEEEATDPNNALFKGPDIPGGATESFPIDPLKKGEYFFNCQYHANMNGAVEVG